MFHVKIKNILLEHNKRKKHKLIMTTRSKLRTGEPDDRKTFGRGKFVNCCVTLSGPEWTIKKEIVTPEQIPLAISQLNTQVNTKLKDGGGDHNDGGDHHDGVVVTLPPCTDLKVKYKITVDRRGDYKVCVFALLKLKVNKDSDCDFSVKVLVQTAEEPPAYYVLGIIPFKRHLSKGLNCIELCKCFNVDSATFASIAGKPIQFKLLSNDCITFSEDEECECEIIVPETPTDSTTPDTVWVTDEVETELDELEGPIDCGDGKFPGFPAQVGPDTDLPYSFCYCRRFKGPNCDCEGFPKTIIDKVKLSTSDEVDGCIVDKDEAKLKVKCCEFELKITPPKVDCDTSWCICKDADVLKDDNHEDKTCIKYTVTLSKNDTPPSVTNGSFIVKGCDGIELQYHATVIVKVGIIQLVSQNILGTTNVPVKLEDVSIIIDVISEHLCKEGLQVCVIITFNSGTLCVETGNIEQDDTAPLRCRCLEECVDIPCCDDDKIKFCEQFHFKPPLPSHCKPTLELCDQHDPLTPEEQVVKGLIDKFYAEGLTNKQCEELSEDLLKQDEIKLCYILCIPDDCCTKYGKICVVNKATVSNDPCDGNDWYKCDRSFENTSSTSTVIKCRVCEDMAIKSAAAKPAPSKRYATIIKRR